MLTRNSKLILACATLMLPLFITGNAEARLSTNSKIVSRPTSDLADESKIIIQDALIRDKAFDRTVPIGETQPCIDGSLRTVNQAGGCYGTLCCEEWTMVFKCVGGVWSSNPADGAYVEGENCTESEISR